MQRRRRAIMTCVILLGFAGWIFIKDPTVTQSQNQTTETSNAIQSSQSNSNTTQPKTSSAPSNEELASSALSKLPVKGRAAKTGYARSQFGDGWAKNSSGCDTRNIILRRDLTDVKLSSDNCKVMSGIFDDPYTGKQILFVRGATTSSLVQIDHVVALSDAWQTGAQQLTAQQREILANDPLELIAVDGSANQQKSDGNAATWLPPNKAFRCQYIARQIAVKIKYSLWVTSAEQSAMSKVLSACPDQKLPSAS